MKKILFAISFFPIICFGTTEDFTTYSCTTNSGFTVTSAKLDMANVNEAEDLRCYVDKGAGYVSGDYDYDFEAYVNSSMSNGMQFKGPTVADCDDYDANNFCDNLNTVTLRHEGGGYYVQLQEYDGGSGYVDAYDGDAGELDTLFYYTLERDEAVGTYGTIYLYIYSDASRETLVDTLSIALHTSKKDYQYIYGVAGYGNEVGSYRLDGYIQNLDLQEATPTPTPSPVLYATSSATSTTMFAMGLISIVMILCILGGYFLIMFLFRFL